MMRNLVVDENLSNLTSTSGEVSASSGSRNMEISTNLYPQQSFDDSSYHQAAAAPAPPPPKKKRSLPGNPDPDAEVIALSPKTLMATNRFICEICNKGFQRDQNLQLHRRGHNLPWKLKQRTSKEIRKKVYVCPQPGCVHHDPARALGDLTGIKKHFCRKHGEKKWKCEKCSKRYAVQSDWKAHNKVCGTREYRCDCGTLFSRRDSFITHRAFCDALAEESARAITGAAAAPPPPGTSSAAHLANLQQQLAVKREQDNIFSGRTDGVPPWMPGIGVGPSFGPDTPPLDLSSSSPLFSAVNFANPNSNPSSAALPQFQASHAALVSPHMSATALLQKAARMGVTMSKPGSETTAGIDIGSGFTSPDHSLTSYASKGSTLVQQMTSNNAAAASSLLHDMMGTMPPSGEFGGASSAFTFSTTRLLSYTKVDNNLCENFTMPETGVHGGGNDGLTRDFLGLKAFPVDRQLGAMNGSSSPSGYGGMQHSNQQQSQMGWQG